MAQCGIATLRTLRRPQCGVIYKRTSHALRNPPPSLRVCAAAGTNTEAALSVLRECALKRSANAEDVVDALMQFEQAGVPVAASAVEGKWELIFSSSVQKVPLLKGYMPVREIITFDKVGSPDGFIRLDTDVLWMTLSMLPGDVYEWDEAGSKLTFNFRKKEGEPPTDVKSWSFIMEADGVLAARSSGTGLNVLRKVE